MQDILCSNKRNLESTLGVYSIEALEATAQDLMPTQNKRLNLLNRRFSDFYFDNLLFRLSVLIYSPNM